MPRHAFVMNSVCALLWVCAPALAGAGEKTGESLPYSEIVIADDPVAYWRFEEKDGETVSSTGGTELVGIVQGAVKLGQEGPRPSLFPLFAQDNRAFSIQGSGNFIRVKDPGEASPLVFTNGDTVTLEAWVNLRELGENRQIYIVGKGRTQNKGVEAENQNYALRLRGVGGSARISFLFRSAEDAEEKPAFHRWNSDVGFLPGSDWHHVAVTYTFGDPKSIRGYLDGQPVTGTWDYAGATKRAPIVDDDELWIGSSMGGSGSSTFNGWIDEVAIYRTALSDERMAARFRSVVAEPIPSEELPPGLVLVEILEGVPDKDSWQFTRPAPVDRYTEPAFGFVEVPQKYISSGVRGDRTNPFLIRATGLVELPAGEYRILVRARSGARLSLDGEQIATVAFHSPRTDGHNPYEPIKYHLGPDVRPIAPGDTESIVTITSPGQVHRFELEAVVGGRKRRPELGETMVGIAGADGTFRLLSPALDVPLSDGGWEAYAAEQIARRNSENQIRRREASEEFTAYWQQRHEHAREALLGQPAPAVPEGATDLPAFNEIDRFINAQLAGTEINPSPLTDDWEFLRRVALDTTGTIPDAELIAAFAADRGPERRTNLIDRMLEHPGWADHWVGYWQDVLAENPNIVNPTLNNTGPFRWWLYESFQDNKPFDRFATELILMEGSTHYGGPAGFGLATQNDAPMAAKAHIISRAFLGIEMNCARCHDAPFHDLKQRDVFAIAGMLARAPQQVPKTSTVPGSDEELSSLIIKVTLKPGEEIPPEWPFAELSPGEPADELVRRRDDLRERLAALITSPLNERFAQVIVNRLWHRYLGRGIVESLDDWEQAKPSHPELLDWLARELVLSGYDLKHVTRLILNSHAYQRQPRTIESGKEASLFAAPLRRRMTAEQVLDSLFQAAGKPLNSEPLNVDVDGSRVFTSSLNLGPASRAWHFTSLSNERDRPSLALPAAQTFSSLLETFGWRASRQDPLTVREEAASVLQPAILANGVVGKRITQLSEDSAITRIALEDQPVDAFIERVYLRVLSRPPTSEERAVFVELLNEGYDARLTGQEPGPDYRWRPPRNSVSWSNHLSEEANRVKLELERIIREGDQPTPRLTADWRERAEDMLWVLVNSPEFVFVP